VLLTSLGGYMWPHGFGASFTAKNSDTIRRNAVVMPIYTLTLAFIFFTGFAALLVAPGLQNSDLALLTIVRRTFPAWMLGVIGGAGALTAMVPAAILVLTASTLFAKNLYRPLFAPGMSDDHVARLARTMVIVLSGVSLYFAMHSSATLVSLLLLGYAGISQFFPGVVLGLFWRRVSKAGVFAGLLAGVMSAAALILGKKDPIGGINAGFIALCVNFAVTVAVSAAGGDPVAHITRGRFRAGV
jgi:SSS family solute:Na+ symporter